MSTDLVPEVIPQPNPAVEFEDKSVILTHSNPRLSISTWAVWPTSERPTLVKENDNHKAYPSALDSLICSICGELYKNPVMLNNSRLSDPSTFPCQHTFCKECIGEWFGPVNQPKNSTCPLCRRETEVADIIPDMNTARRIGDVIIRCRNTPHGCDKRYAMGLNGKANEEHLRICEYQGKTCIDCKEIILWGEDEEKHETKCLEKQITCVRNLIDFTRGCGLVYRRKDQHAHNTQFCEERILCCILPFAHKDCGQYFNPRELSEHDKKYELQHLKYEKFCANHKIDKLEKDLTKTSSDLYEEKKRTSLYAGFLEIDKKKRSRCIAKYEWKTETPTEKYRAIGKIESGPFRATVHICKTKCAVILQTVLDSGSNTFAIEYAAILKTTKIASKVEESANIYSNGYITDFPLSSMDGHQSGEQVTIELVIRSVSDWNSNRKTVALPVMEEMLEADGRRIKRQRVDPFAE